MNREILLIIEGKTPYDKLFIELKDALMGGVDKVLLTQPISYTNFELARLGELCHNYESEIFMLEDEVFAREHQFDGVHLNNIPTPFETKQDKQKLKYGISVEKISQEIPPDICSQLDYVMIGANVDDLLKGKLDKVDTDELKNHHQDHDIPLFFSGKVEDNVLEIIANLSIKGVVIPIKNLKRDEILAQIKQLKASLNKDHI